MSRQEAIRTVLAHIQSGKASPTLEVLQACGVLHEELESSTIYPESGSEPVQVDGSL